MAFAFSKEKANGAKENISFLKSISDVPSLDTIDKRTETFPAFTLENGAISAEHDVPPCEPLSRSVVQLLSFHLQKGAAINPPLCSRGGALKTRSPRVKL